MKGPEQQARLSKRASMLGRLLARGRSSLTEFPEWFRPQWSTVRQQLIDGSYRPSPARRVTIDKPDGGTRELGIPNVLDRLIQTAIVLILNRICRDQPTSWASPLRINDLLSDDLCVGYLDLTSLEDVDKRRNV